MRKCSWTLIVCLTVLFAVTPVRAQTPSPDAMAAARELIVTMHAVELFQSHHAGPHASDEARDRSEPAGSRARLRCDGPASAGGHEYPDERPHRAGCGALCQKFHRR